MSHDCLANVSRETKARLAGFQRLYEKWSPRINLTAPSTRSDFWTRHVADSAQLLDLAPDANDWVDLGSGGGFPGMVLAILLEGQPGKHVALVESNRKKTAFLQAVKAECAPHAVIYPERIEAIVPVVEAPEIVTARALAELDTLLDMTSAWLTNTTRALFHKGRGYASEVEETHAKWDYDLVVHESVVEPDSVILEIANLQTRNNS
jgi:16S rRNA (guanine527-N7)-methyltransferase